ncbi:hypothetical protein O6R08_02745 [Cutibacterium equinum]|uniref:DUF4230 domain-containing protein n=1 Tax=Cutibacterium equinum TaxID=3016342 RepID=A0ABY7R119_9ACTN|nr:hypothetical protein [Cutibacterium equinum]WCC80457.1 hypothetical protein O6R08_02745 [Cutibacterium equinum]
MSKTSSAASHGATAHSRRKPKGFGVKGALSFLLIGVLLGGGVIMWGSHRSWPGFGDVAGTSEKTTDRRVVESMELKGDVILLSMRMEGILQKDQARTLGGHEIWGTTKTQFIQYGYDAQLGVDGQAVKVKREDPTHITVTVPPFKFIGHSNEEFKKAAENDGALSFVTADIDTAKAITEVLNPATEQQQVKENGKTLKAQCEKFYRGIAEGIDPNVKIKFVYKNAS